MTDSAAVAVSTIEANNELNAERQALDNYAPVIGTENATLRVS